MQMPGTPWLTALALAASLLVACNDKRSSPWGTAGDPAAAPSAPTATTQPPASPGAPAAAPPPPAAAPPAAAPTAVTPAPAAAPAPTAAAPVGPGLSAEVMLRRLTGATDKICACPDLACADAISTALQREDGQLAGLPSSTEAESLKAQAVRMNGCLQKLGRPAR